MDNYENAQEFYAEDKIYDSPLDELLSEEERDFIDVLLENRGMFDEVLSHLPPDMEMEFAAAQDNAMIDALIDELEEKVGRELTDIERIELENEILSGLITAVGVEE